MKTRIRLRTVIAALALSASFACAGKGCSCVTPIKGGFPVGDRHEGALQVRAGKALFDYLGQNGTKLITGLLPGGSTFNVPPSCGGSNQICCAMPAPMCRINLDFKTLAVTPQAGSAPARLHLNTTLILKTMDNLPVDVSGIHCVVSLDTTRAGSPIMTVDSDITFPVDKTTDNTELQLANTSVTGIDDGDLNINEPGSDFTCTIATFIPGVKSFVVSTLESQVASQIDKAASSATCMKCMDKTDCNSFATDCKSGTCVKADGKTCVQEIGIDGRMDVGKSLASFSPSTKAGIDVMAVLGGWAVADTGLSLGMLGGGLSDPHSDCVPMTTKPSPAAVPASKTFSLDALPDGDTPFHLGIGVHKSFLDQVGWAAFDGGAICLDIGTPQVALLTAKTIGVVIPSLSDLTHGDAPMFLVMRPHAPPTFTLGKGTFVTDMNGMKKIDDALLHVHVPDFHIDFYAWIDERYVRIMTLNADLNIPISLEVDAMGKITPLLGDFAKAFTNVTVTNSELLAESPADLAKTFPTLLGLAGGQLAGVLKPISLPAVMGLNIKPTAITSTDDDSNGNAQFLSIFANLSATAAQSLSLHTHARLVDVQLPTRSEFAVDKRTGAQPTVYVDVDGRGVMGAHEFSWQLDGAGWSPFTETSTLVVQHPLLWLPGQHTLEVRGRAVGLPDTVALAPETISVPIDPPSFHGRTTNPPPSGGCGCDVGGAGDDTSWPGIVVTLAVGYWLFRRRRFALPWLLLLGGCNSGLGKGDYEAPFDEIGRYSDAIAQNGTLHISAYDDSVGDLVYAKVTDPSLPVGWQVVDGIDPNATVDTPGGYRRGISDPGPDVGYYTSIALTADGRPRIAYFDLTDNAVKLAIGPHPWKTVTVDSSSQKGVKVGLYTAISLDASNVPSIAYLATGISDGAGGFRSELRLATANSSSPGDGEFTITVVDKQRVSCAGRCGGGQACIQAAMVNGMPNGDPSQSSCTATTTTCTAMCAATEACITGTCTKFLAAPKALDLVEGIGLFTRALHVNGNLALVYYDRQQGDLKLAVQSGGAFGVSFVDGNDPSTDVGQNLAATVDDSSTIHIAYQDAIHDRLLYKTVQGTTPTMTPEVIDDGRRDDGPHPVGAGAAIVATGGAPRVVYQDQKVSDLLIASRSGSTWSHQSLSTGLAGYGFYPRLAVDGAKVWLTQFVYDRENANPPLGTLQISTLP